MANFTAIARLRYSGLQLLLLGRSQRDVGFDLTQSVSPGPLGNPLKAAHEVVSSKYPWTSAVLALERWFPSLRSTDQESCSSSPVQDFVERLVEDCCREQPSIKQLCHLVQVGIWPETNYVLQVGGYLGTWVLLHLEIDTVKKQTQTYSYLKLQS